MKTKSLMIVGLVALAVFGWSTAGLAATVDFYRGDALLGEVVLPDSPLKALVVHTSSVVVSLNIFLVDPWTEVYGQGSQKSLPNWFFFPTLGSLGLSSGEYELRVGVSGAGLFTHRVILLSTGEAGLTEAEVQTLISAAIDTDNVADDAAVDAEESARIAADSAEASTRAAADAALQTQINELKSAFNSHVHDKGSGSRMTSGPIIPTP